MPPIVARSASGGSRAMNCRCRPRVAWVSLSRLPARRVAVISAGSWSTTPLRRESARTRSTRSGMPPNAIFVPPPQGITFSPSAEAKAMMAETSSTDPGEATALGTFPSTAYREASGPATTCGAPRSPLKRLDNASSDNTVILLRAPEHLVQDGALPRGPDLDARLGRREDLPGVEQPAGIKDPLHLAHGLQVVAGELQRHVVPLLQADTMLAGEAAAHLDAGLDDLGSHLLRLAELPFVPGVRADERVEVAVARVKDVGHPEAVFLGQLPDQCHDGGELGPRDDRILDVIFGADLAHGGEGGLPPLPEQEPLVVIPRHSDLPCAVLLADLGLKWKINISRKNNLHEQRS